MVGIPGDIWGLCICRGPQWGQRHPRSLPPMWLLEQKSCILYNFIKDDNKMIFLPFVLTVNRAFYPLYGMTYCQKISRYSNFPLVEKSRGQQVKPSAECGPHKFLAKLVKSKKSKWCRSLKKPLVPLPCTKNWKHSIDYNLGTSTLWLKSRQICCKSIVISEHSPPLVEE